MFKNYNPKDFVDMFIYHFWSVLIVMLELSIKAWSFLFFAIFAVTEYGAFTMNISTTMLNCNKQGLFLAVRG